MAFTFSWRPDMHRWLSLLSSLLLVTGCAVADVPTDDCITATLETELGVPTTECPVSGDDDANGKADGARAIDRPGLRFLRARTERELAALFATGRADAIPSGRNDGTALLLGLDWLAPALSQI